MQISRLNRRFACQLLLAAITALIVAAGATAGGSANPAKQKVDPVDSAFVCDGGRTYTLTGTLRVTYRFADPKSIYLMVPTVTAVDEWGNTFRAVGAVVQTQTSSNGNTSASSLILKIQLVGTGGSVDSVNLITRWTSTGGDFILNSGTCLPAEFGG